MSNIDIQQLIQQSKGDGPRRTADLPLPTKNNVSATNINSQHTFERNSLINQYVTESYNQFHMDSKD